MNRKTGAVFLPWIFILLMLCSLIWLLNQLNAGIKNTERCEDQLKKIYNALVLYEMDNGRLPSFELYPSDPEGNVESMLNRLSELPDFDPEWLCCPASPEILKEHGTTYLWNVALNHSSLSYRDEITWVLVDMQALVDGVPGPHFGSYLILYSDGRVERSSSPPHSLPVQYE
ncbi:hypothetical protein P0Y35_18290 [Kiritimatiellaeota bacterium B1221]|nr:hypothetical protein [Kiritimatiellaeota bacterium B1221]